jgi:hypothetical protein
VCLCLVQNGLFRGEGFHQGRMAFKFREKKDWQTWCILGNYRRSLLNLASARDRRGRRESTVSSRFYLVRVLFRCSL